MHVHAFGRRVAPLVNLGPGLLGELFERLLIKCGHRRGAHHTFALGNFFERRVLGRGFKRIPAGTVLGVEVDRGREILEARFLLIGLVTVLGFPEVALRYDELAERRAVLAFDDVGELFSKCLKTWIREWLCRCHRDCLIRLRRRGWRRPLALRGRWAEEQERQGARCQRSCKGTHQPISRIWMTGTIELHSGSWRPYEGLELCHSKPG